MDIKPIKTKDEYEAALNEIQKLWGAVPNTTEGKKLVALVAQVEAYEKEHFPIDPPDNYSEILDPDDCVMTVQEFRDNCECGGFIDYDGFGHPVCGGRVDRGVTILPSKVKEIPRTASHIVWYNK